eukprot:6449274-Karenia_brevis.AAC.1
MLNGMFEIISSLKIQIQVSSAAGLQLGLASLRKLPSSPSYASLRRAPHLSAPKPLLDRPLE